MRAFFIFLVTLIIGAMLLIFGNMMRCISASGDACPGMCFQRTVDCRSDTDSICETKKVCRAPDLADYWLMIKTNLRELKYKL